MWLRSFLFLSFYGLFSGLNIQAQTIHDHSRVTIDASHLVNGLEDVARLGIAVDHGDIGDQQRLTTDLSAREMLLLRDNGIPFEVIIDDVAAFYVERNSPPIDESERDFNDICEPFFNYPVPANFTLGTMGGFYTWDAMLGIIDEMHNAYPNLISLKEPIGTSHENRPIHFVRISNDPSVDQDKPEVLYNALHHSREPASLSQMVFYMWYLLENYGTDPEVTYLVDNMEMYFIPCVNPDGYVFNGTNNPAGGGLWRKNRKDNGDGTFGVDLNRNYGYQWGYDDVGSSTVPSSEVYRGTEAFSEPETQAMRDFCNAHEFWMAMNYHSYGNLLIHGWSYSSTAPLPDANVFFEQGEHISYFNNYIYGPTYQTLWYGVNGSSDDWMYGEQTTKGKIFAYTPEVGTGNDGFWPAESRITTLCQENMGANLRTAHLAMQYAVTTDGSSPVLGSLSPWIPFNIKRLGQEPGPFTVSITPLDNVISAGVPVTFTGMGLLETRTDSIQLQLQPTAVSGDPVRFVLSVDNGFYSFNDTISKIVGTPNIVLADGFTGATNWSTGSWGPTTTTYFSPPSSITDSPNGTYSTSINSLTLLQPIDLSLANTATLDFMAKWDIHPGDDQVQVSASIDGASWMPLCGRYTRAGTLQQGINEPVFEGRQQAWVHEQMDLTEFVGGPVRIQFSLNPAGSYSWDGFFLDDLVVTTTSDGSVNVIPIAPSIVEYSNSPNPSHGNTTISYSLPPSAMNYAVKIYNALGSEMIKRTLNSNMGTIPVNTSTWSAGVYFYTISNEGYQGPLQRMVVE